jgi:uncharacterized protein YcbK (DUF882 family)
MSDTAEYTSHQKMMLHIEGVIHRHLFPTDDHARIESMHIDQLRDLYQRAGNEIARRVSLPAMTEEERAQIADEHNAAYEYGEHETLNRALRGIRNEQE